MLFFGFRCRRLGIGVPCCRWGTVWGKVFCSWRVEVGCCCDDGNDAVVVALVVFGAICEGIDTRVID